MSRNRDGHLEFNGRIRDCKEVYFKIMRKVGDMQSQCNSQWGKISFPFVCLGPLQYLK